MLRKMPNLCVKLHFGRCLTFTQHVWKNQTCWYTYTWVLFSTHVWILTHMYGKKHTCVKKATQLYICKYWAFSTHVWEKPLTCLFPPELWVPSFQTSKPINNLGEAIFWTNFPVLITSATEPGVKSWDGKFASPNLSARLARWGKGLALSSQRLMGKLDEDK